MDPTTEFFVNEDSISSDDKRTSFGETDGLTNDTYAQPDCEDKIRNVFIQDGSIDEATEAIFTLMCGKKGRRIKNSIE